MALEVGIVGLPNAGKSTLFNALAARRLAETAPRPFTTIEPHEAVVSVPDSDLERLSKLVKPQETVPATVTFIDIAGLVKGAHKGEGLGNQFLGKIREVDAIVHVVRGFFDQYVTHQHIIHEPGTLKQVLYDIEIVNLELQLAGIEGKPTIYVLNVGESEVADEVEMKRWIINITEKYKDPAVVIAAKLEEDLSDLNPLERKQYLKEAKIKKSGLEQLISWAYELLDLNTFYTIKGGKEVRAWSLKEGSSAVEAAETVHTDFAKNFITAEVCSVNELLKLQPLQASLVKADSKNIDIWKLAKDKGKVRLEGRDYIVKDKDVIEFKVGS